MRRSIPHPAPEHTSDDRVTPVRWWPWLVGLLVLDVVCAVALWVGLSSWGENSQPTPGPKPTPSPASFSAEHPDAELVPGASVW